MTRSASPSINATTPLGQPAAFVAVDSQGGDGRAILDAMIRDPYQFDFFQAVRRIESLTPSLPRIGWATRADQEVLRIGQSVHLDFAPSTIDGVSQTASGFIRLQQRFFGLWGPSGALPLPMTESARDQWRHEGDRTQIAFADLFHHRMATLLYRVWSTSRGVVQRDRPNEDRFADYVSSLAGLVVRRKPQSQRKQPCKPLPNKTALRPVASSTVTDHRRFHAARYGIRRNASGLQDLIAGALAVPVEVGTFVSTKLHLREEDHACLTRSGERSHHRNTLGGGVILGRRVEDHASTIEVRIGPLDLASYRSFMPGGEGHGTLAELVRGYIGRGLQVRIQLILQRKQAPPMCLGKSSTIGRDAWFSSAPKDRDADDYRFFL